ncbi:MAG: CHAP domain-containing protein [Novosphingobium sp.]
MGLRGKFIGCALIVLGALSLGAPLAARIAVPDDDVVTGGGGSTLPPYLQCVPYARQVTGIQIRGDAWTWWDQADGRYARGFWPKVGAVMALKPHGNSHLGHVAAVSRIIDSRTILIRHSNWSPINGRRGQIEDNVKVIDVSDANDWSAVRVWYAPIQALGGSVWPVQGFIYSGKPPKISAMSALQPAKTKSPGAGPTSLLPDRYDNAPSRSRGGKTPRSPIADIIGEKMGW